MRGSEPGERRGGRLKGTPNLRTIAATELVKRAQERFPGYNPIEALIALAESSDDPALAKECHAAVLPYMAPKFRPVVADPDALVSLEARIARARLEAQAKTLDENPGLADRLARALARNAEETALLAASRPVVVNMEPEPVAPQPVSAACAPAAPEPAPSPAPASVPAGNDWTYSPILPETQAFATMEDENDGFLSAYRDTGG